LANQPEKRSTINRWRRYLFRPYDRWLFLLIAILLAVYFLSHRSSIALLILGGTVFLVGLMVLVRFMNELLTSGPVARKLHGPITYRKVFQINQVHFFLVHEQRPWLLIFSIIFGLVLVALIVEAIAK
jgi:hypothetical protein